ncbi:MAG: ABC transporter permease [Cyclobacteriaceae bacterium]
MVKNYINVALRNLLKHKFYSGINILGLTVGITCFLMIFLYVQHELSYDKFHTGYEDIYRLDFSGILNAEEIIIAVASAPAKDALVADFPEVIDGIRFRTQGNFLVKQKDGTETLKEENVSYVDANFFDFFTVPLIRGDEKSALSAPNTLALSESASKKYFGDEDPIGKVLVLDNRHDYEVTAVYEDIPNNSHFDFDMLLSMEGLEEARMPIWMSFNFNTYFKLQPGTDPAVVDAKFPAIVKKYIGPEIQRFMGASFDEFAAAGNKMAYFLFPMTDIHLQSDKMAELAPNGDIKYIYIFSAVAFFILLIACINFMNLSTARSANRSKEVGIRKVMGAYRHQLIRQFLAEAMIMSLVSFLLALAFTALLLPYFNDLAAKSLQFSDLINPTFIGSAVAAMLFVGLIAGSYPAFYLSGFRPVEVLKGKLNLGMKSGGLRSVLVVFQFWLSVIMIAGTAVVFDQLDYIQNKKLGFDKDQIIMLHDAWVMGDKVESYKNEVLQNTKILNGTITSFLPVGTSNNNTVFFPGTSPEGQNTYVMSNWRVDYDYIPTLGMELVAGRNLSRDFPSDSLGIIINEAAARQLGFEDPLGETITTFGGDDPSSPEYDSYKIVGVVKDFHYESLRTNITPLVLYLGHSRGYVSFKIQGNDVQETVSFLQKKWDEFAPGQPFAYSFLDQRFSSIYENEQKIGNIFSVFAFLAIFIACLGLFGLAAFTAEQRYKEIGVRKVLGASITSIMALLSKEFIKLMIIAFVLAVPLAYYGMDLWLQDFAFRTELQPMTFVLAGVITFVISWTTMSFQSLRAARTNPVKALRDE